MVDWRPEVFSVSDSSHPVKWIDLKANGYYQTSEALEYLGVKSRSYLDWLVISGMLPAYRIGPKSRGGLRVYRFDDLDRLKKKRAAAQAASS